MINLLHLLIAQDLVVQRRVGQQGHDFRPLVRKCHSRRNGSEWKLWKSSTHCPKVLQKLYRYKVVYLNEVICSPNYLGYL